MNLEIYPRFQDLLSPLVGAEAEQLEQSILADGIREPIRTWQNKIVDGHHRYALAEMHNVPYETVEMEFEDEDAVCEWMIVNQIGRRNLNSNIKTLLIGQLYELQKKRVGNPALLEKQPETPVNSNVATVATLGKRTDEKIAEQFDVSPRTVRSAEKVHKAFEQSDAPTKDAFKRGEISQKKLVETQRPKPVAPKDERHDAITELAKEYGNKIQTAVRNFEALLSEANEAFAAKGMQFSDFAWDTSVHKFDLLTNEAHFLKKFVKCPACHGAKCKHCKFGYVTEDKEKTITDIENHRAVVHA